MSTRTTGSATPATCLSIARREVPSRSAGVALPVVLVLTGAQQRAHAQSNGSNPVTPTTPGPGTTSPGTTSPGLPTTTREPLDFDIFKSYGPPSDLTIRLPLPGAVFEVKNAQGTVVGTMTTNTDGFATIELPPGTYTFTETFAPSPPGPFQPLPVLTVTLTDDDQGRDLHNLLVNPL